MAEGPQKKNQYASVQQAYRYDDLKNYAELAGKEYRDARKEWFDAEVAERAIRDSDGKVECNIYNILRIWHFS